MFVSLVHRFRLLLVSSFLILSFAVSLRAQSSSGLHGKVVDPLGNAVPNAKIVLLQKDKEMVRGSSGADGSFHLDPPNGRYTPRVDAEGFATPTLTTATGSGGKK